MESSKNIQIKRIYASWVYVKDLKKSIDFYQNIGFKVKFVENNWAEFDLGNTSFAILERPLEKEKFTPEKTRIMFEVDHIEEVYQILQTKNVKIIGNIRNENYGKLLTFEDIDGNWLEFFENRK